MPTKVPSKYKVSLEVAGETWKAEGNSVESAIKKLTVSYHEIWGKGIITVSKGNKKLDYLTNALKIRRMLSNKIVRAKQAQNLEHLLTLGKKTNIPQ